MKLHIVLGSLGLLVSSCVQKKQRTDFNALDTSPGTAGALPSLSSAERYIDMVSTQLRLTNLKNSPLKDKYISKISHYLSFIGADEQTSLNVTKRLLSSSTQFLLCNFEDWACLERDPTLVPKAAHRVPESNGLGSRIFVPENFKMESYFTEQWDKPDADVNKTVASTLAKSIRQYGTKGVSMALYGIDDIDDSLKSVYDAIKTTTISGSDVRAVVDRKGILSEVTSPLLFSYKKSTLNNWIFSQNSEGKTNILFQYKETPSVFSFLNANATDDFSAKARLEYPDQGIMHNKFFVFDDGTNLRVWSGTANVSETCMGTERNTNMSVLVHNRAIAESFLKEFSQMYEYIPQAVVDTSNKFVGIDGTPRVNAGRFHKNKRPVANRYFKFADNHEVRVHFSPTDDAEHRAILPMLLSARRGDDIRVAMFGGAGIELVRAFQYAASQGARVRIVFDRLTGAGRGSWIKSTEARLNQVNPFRPSATHNVEIRLSTWNKLNHHKTATLTRTLPNGKTRAEVLIVGSQNWSSSGNDQNDENNLTIRNTATGVEAAEQFNEHFDRRLWPASAAGVVPITEEVTLPSGPETEFTDEE